MTPAELALYRRLPPPPRCRICAGTSGHEPIEGDGEVVCRPCLYRAGDAAARPETLTLGVLALLTDAHGDVVRLATDGRGAVWWRWVGDRITGQTVTDAIRQLERRPR